MNIPSIPEQTGQVRDRNAPSPLHEEFQSLKELELEEMFKQNISIIRFVYDFSLKTLDGVKKAWNNLYHNADVQFSQNNRYTNIASGLLMLLTLRLGSNPDLQLYAQYLLSKDKTTPSHSSIFNINYSIISTTSLNFPSQDYSLWNTKLPVISSRFSKSCWTAASTRSKHILLWMTKNKQKAL